LVRASLETDFAEVWLEGEISNLRAPGSGHLYCTLKDDSSQIRAVIFRSTALRLRFGLEDGLHIIARGRVTVYEPRGEYQVVFEYVEPKGLGALQLAFEQLKSRLAAEGLFDESRKRPLPAFPQTIGIVTSLTGAAIQDMITVLHRRCPILGIIVAPVQVQGDGSAEQIASAIRSLNELGRVDVIIVGRGGGSWEDLWSFNEELVVRAIVASPIPVVSAVGHETDVTLADFAADMRAPTPSAAAEAVAPVLNEIVAQLGDLTVRCRQAVSWRCDVERQRLDLVLAQMTNIRFRILEETQRVDGAVVQMRQAVQDVLRRRWEQVHSSKHELISRSPESRVRHGMAIVPHLLSRLEGVMRYGLNRRKQEARSCLTSLNNLSPLGILARGYSIVETVSTHQVIRDARQVSAGQEVLTRLAKGRLRCTVNEVMTDPSV
jgi:exodeoxyribonuclease VII large subunit